MLKAALLCSAICTAFVVGDYSPMPQQTRVRVVKPVSLHEVLKPLVGKDCYAFPSEGMWYISFENRNAKHRGSKLDMIGSDFLRLSSTNYKTYIPFSSIRHIKTD